MDVYVVIPGYNEAEYLTTFLTSLLSQTKDIVYIDDGSADKSVEIAKGQLKHVLVHEVNLGKGAALKTGCEYVFGNLQAAAVVFMDADNQHNPQELPRFYQELRNGAQVVFGARKFSPNMPLDRLLGNKLASIILNLLFKKYIPDVPSGYKAMTKEAYNRLKWDATGYEVETEIAAKVARYGIPYRVLEVETIYHDVNKGITLIDAMHIMKFLLQLRLEL